MSGKHSIVVESRENMTFNVVKMYREEDKSFQNPITHMLLTLKDVEINLI